MLLALYAKQNRESIDRARFRLRPKHSFGLRVSLALRRPSGRRETRYGALQHQLVTDADKQTRYRLTIAVADTLWGYKGICGAVRGLLVVQQAAAHLL
jgi:hypothetical protein